MIDDTVNIPAYHRVRYNGSESELFLAWFEDISDATDGVYQCRVKLLVDFIAQTGNTRLNHVGMRIKIVIPDMFDDHGFCYNTSCIAHQIFEQAEFPGLQVDFFPGTRYLARKCVDGEVVYGKSSGFSGIVASPDQGLHSGKQFGKCEGFCEIVIAADSEAFHAVIHRAFCTQDQHRQIYVVFSQVIDN